MFAKPIDLLCAFLFWCLLLAGLSACTKQEPPNHAALPEGVSESSVISLSPEQLAALKLEFATAGWMPEMALVDVTGEVLANANLLARINSPITGRVTQVLVSVGDRAASGQTLAWIKSNDIEQLEANLLQNDAQVKADLKRDLLQIDSDLNQDKEQLSLSSSTYDRVSALYNDKIASRADYEAARTQYEKDSIAVNMTQRKRTMTLALAMQKLRVLTEPIKQSLRVLGVSDATISDVLKTHRIEPLVPVYAPESGIVVERLINSGEIADPSKPIFTIGDFRNVWLKADVPEKHIANIKAGQEIELTLDSFPSEVFHGKLNYVADIVNENTRTLPVRAQVDNPDLKLKPDMFGTMRIFVGRKEVLVVPRDAIQNTGSSTVVYVPLGSATFVERKVTVGKTYGDRVEILSGLTVGEKVVTAGDVQLREYSLRKT